jgi:predicted transcriptional regulator
MTMRDFLTAVVEDKLNDEMLDYAREAIKKLDARNEKRRNTESKTAKANAPIKAEILAYVEGSHPAIASEIAKALNITTQKASALCRQLVDEGTLVSGETKIPKKGKVKAYTLPTESGEVDGDEVAVEVELEEEEDE